MMCVDSFSRWLISLIWICYWAGSAVHDVCGEFLRHRGGSSSQTSLINKSKLLKELQLFEETQEETKMSTQNLFTSEFNVIFVAVSHLYLNYFDLFVSCHECTKYWPRRGTLKIHDKTNSLVPLCCWYICIPITFFLIFPMYTLMINSESLSNHTFLLMNWTFIVEL